MGAAAVPLAVAGAGLVGGMMQNDTQRRAANRAAGQQQELLNRQREIFDTINNLRRLAEGQGFFDPKKRIAQIDKNSAEYEARDLGNLAGALRVAGYRPGDSELGVRLDAVKRKHKGDRERQYAEAERQSFFDHINAVAAANGGMLNPGIEAAQRQQEIALSRIQNPAGFLASLLPYLDQFGRGRGNGNAYQQGGSVLGQPNSGGGWSYGGGWVGGGNGGFGGSGFGGGRGGYGYGNGGFGG